MKNSNNTSPIFALFTVEGRRIIKLYCRKPQAASRKPHHNVYSKVIFSFLLYTALIFSFCAFFTPGPALADWPEPESWQSKSTSSIDDPYLIAVSADLLYLAQKVNTDSGY